MIKIQPYKNSDLKNVLSLIEKSDSTNRSIETWRGNDMTAVLAFDGDDLIGIIPFEKRRIVLDNKRCINALWVSAAHVEPEYRSKGIGSQLDNSINDFFSDDFQAVLVYRQDEQSPAYKWYKKTGYSDLLPISALKKGVEAPSVKTEYILIETEKEVLDWGQKILDCFKRNIGFYTGFPERDKNFWANKFEVHYYKEFYKYCILAFIQDKAVISYAFLGQTNMRDGIERFDILEMIVANDPDIRNDFFNAIMDHACNLNVKEVRIQFSYQDHDLVWLQSIGFVHRWRTNILGKFINPIHYLRNQLYGIAGLCDEYSFFLETPALGEQKIGNGGKVIKLFFQDDELQRILFGRSDIDGSLKQGRLLVLQGEKEFLEILKEIFPLEMWRYFQIDYI